MVKEAGIFDYYDKTPPPGEIDAYLAASAKCGTRTVVRAAAFSILSWSRGPANGIRNGMSSNSSLGRRSCGMLRHHASSAESTLQHISTEFLPGID
jgi:hypothetical protein